MDAEYRAELLRRFGKAVEDLSPVEMEQLMDYIRALRQSGAHSSCTSVSCEALMAVSVLGASVISFSDDGVASSESPK